MKKIILSIVFIIIIFTALYFTTSPVRATELNLSSIVTSFKSNNEMSDENLDSVNITNDENVLTISYKSKIAAIMYKVCLTRADLSQITLGVIDAEDYENGMNGFEYSCDLNNYSIESGVYYLYIQRARNEYQIGRMPFGDGGNCYRNTLIEVTDEGEINIRNYANIVTNNNAIKAKTAYDAPELFLDKDLEDSPYCLVDNTDTPIELTSEKLTAIQNVAERITAGCTSNYEKALAVYEYVSTNTYYDVYSNEHSSCKTVNNPYMNINRIETEGKTTTTCVGYSAMVTALLRSVDVPTRVVFGYHLSIPSGNWENVDFEASDFKFDNHYWTEFYDGSRWVTCDANMGTSNKWTRNTASDSGEWIGGNEVSEGVTEKSLNNYTYFDPSPEQLALSHCMMGIYSKKIISNANDVSKLLTILNYTNSSGVTNATQLGASSDNIRNDSVVSWNLDKLYAISTTGTVRKIDWAGSSSADGNFYGPCDLSSMVDLKWFTASYNKNMTSLNLNNDPSLVSVYASSCNLKTFTATNCGELVTVNISYNPLTKAVYTFNGNKKATVQANTGGTVYVTYSGGTHKITAKAKDGYYFIGWYNECGTKRSSDEVYSFTSTGSFTRIAKFKKLAAPTNVKVSNVTPVSSHKITWDKVDGASGYYFYISTSKNSGYVRTKITSGDTTTITKNGLKTGTTYYYYVVAYRNIEGKTYPITSAESEKITKTARPPTPSITLTSTTKGVITVKWKKTKYVNGYEVLRSTSKDGTYTVVKRYDKNVTTDYVTFKNSNLTSGKTYYYKVRSYKTVNGTKVYSFYSTIKSIKAK